MNHHGYWPELTRSLRTAAAAAAAAALLVAAPAAASAQSVGDVSIDGYGGIALAGGDFAALPLDGTGTTFGARIGYYVHPRVSVGADATLQSWSANEQDAPDFDLVYYTVGAELLVTPPEETRWRITFNGSAGGASVDSDPFTFVDGATGSLSETWPAFRGGVDFGYALSEQVNLYLGAQGSIIGADPQVTRQFRTLSPKIAQEMEARSPPGGANDITTFPIYAGFKVRF